MRPRATMPFSCDIRVRVTKLFNAISATHSARSPASWGQAHHGLVVMPAVLSLDIVDANSGAIWPRRTLEK